MQKMLSVGAEVASKSLIDFSAHPFEVPTTVDWIFFYSKRGIRYYFEVVNASENRLKIACIGTGTANYLWEGWQLKADFVGNGEPQETAAAFLKVAKDLKVAFVRALDSKKSVQQLIESSITVVDCIVYTNIPISHTYSFSGEILVFTSPLNATAYFAKNTLLPQQKIVAIGNSTAEALKQAAINDCTIAEEPSEEALADAVLKLIV